MLCPTCPKRSTCQSACPDLNRELRKYEKGPFKGLRSPQGIGRLEEAQAEQRYYIEEYPPTRPSEEPGDLPIELDSGLDPELKIDELYSAMENLTEKQLQCIRLYYWEELTQNEIAEKLGITRQTVNQHLESAHARLRKEYLRDPFKTTCPLTSVLVRGPNLQSA